MLGIPTEAEDLEHKKVELDSRRTVAAEKGVAHAIEQAERADKRSKGASVRAWIAIAVSAVAALAGIDTFTAHVAPSPGAQA